MSQASPSTLESFVRHERSAWQWLPGCETTPSNPYTADFLDGLLQRLPQESHPRKWDDVLTAWRSAAIGKDGRCEIVQRAQPIGRKVLRDDLWRCEGDWRGIGASALSICIADVLTSSNSSMSGLSAS